MKKWMELSPTLLATHACPPFAPGATPGDRSAKGDNATGQEYVTEINYKDPVSE